MRFNRTSFSSTLIFICVQASNGSSVVCDSLECAGLEAGLTLLQQRARWHNRRPEEEDEDEDEDQDFDEETSEPMVDPKVQESTTIARSKTELLVQDSKATEPTKVPVSMEIKQKPGEKANFTEMTKANQTEEPIILQAEAEADALGDEEEASSMLQTGETVSPVGTSDANATQYDEQASHDSNMSASRPAEDIGTGTGVETASFSSMEIPKGAHRPVGWLADEGGGREDTTTQDDLPSARSSSYEQPLTGGGYILLPSRLVAIFGAAFFVLAAALIRILAYRHASTLSSKIIRIFKWYHGRADNADKTTRMVLEECSDRGS